MRARLGPVERDLTAGLTRVASTDSRPVEIATPISFGGFTQGTLQQFGSQLRGVGLEPRQGLSGGHAGGPTPAGQVEPGSMISVQLVTGDLSVGADGTVTHLDGGKVYAFGHRFLSLGATDLPFARASVLTLLANVSTSFKISEPWARFWAG